MSEPKVGGVCVPQNGLQEPEQGIHGGSLQPVSQTEPGEEDTRAGEGTIGEQGFGLHMVD